MSVPLTQPLTQEHVAACTNRQDRLRSGFEAAGIDALLVSGENDIRYLTGYVGHDSLLLVTADATYIISDPRYDEFLEPWGALPLGSVVMGTRHRLEESVKQLAAKGGVKRLGIQAERVTITGRAKFESKLAGVTLVDTSGLVGQLRMRKDAVEVATIERAIEIQQQALAAALDSLTLGMTEIQFCAVMEYEMKVRGSFAPSFDIMVSTGANSSIIHHTTGNTVIQPGTLLLDWGAKVEGYSSDLTRTFGLGSMPEKVRDIYAIVLEAQLAAIDACAPGKVCAEIDAVARRIITDAGYGAYFGHGLGHGLGMDTHEPPFFNNLQTDITLEPGMVMTVEPGIYLPGVGGVRIEDDVLITEDGARVLSNWPKDMNSMMIELDSAGKSAAQEICS